MVAMRVYIYIEMKGIGNHSQATILQHLPPHFFGSQVTDPELLQAESKDQFRKSLYDFVRIAILKWTEHPQVSILFRFLILFLSFKWLGEWVWHGWVHARMKHA